MPQSNSSTYGIDLFIWEMQVLDRHDCLRSESFVDFVEIDIVFGYSGFGQDGGDCECGSDTAGALASVLGI